MEIKQELKVDTQVLENINKGYNFLNVDNKRDKKSKKYYLEILLDIQQNLKETREEICIKTNILNQSRFCEYSIEDFLKDLNEYVRKPYVIIKETSNRINEDRYDNDINGLRDLIRDKHIIFADIDFRIGELAKEKINKNLIEEIKEILSQQAKVDKKNQKLMDRFIYLKEKVLTLKTLIEETKTYWNKPKDNTLKILITTEEYNEKLKVIEEELKVIAKVFGLELREMDYIVVEEELSYDEWLEDNKDDLQENYKIYCENDDYEGCSDFEEYCKMMFEEFGNNLDEY